MKSLSDFKTEISLVLVIAGAVWGGFEYSTRFVTKDVHAEVCEKLAGVSKSLDAEILLRQIRQLQIDYKCFDKIA